MTPFALRFAAAMMMSAGVDALGPEIKGYGGDGEALRIQRRQ
jgi:hypothetical protein